MTRCGSLRILLLSAAVSGAPQALAAQVEPLEPVLRELAALRTTGQYFGAAAIIRQANAHPSPVLALAMADSLTALVMRTAHPTDAERTQVAFAVDALNLSLVPALSGRPLRAVEARVLRIVDSAPTMDARVSALVGVRHFTDRAQAVAILRRLILTEDSSLGPLAIMQLVQLGPEGLAATRDLYRQLNRVPSADARIELRLKARQYGW